VRAQALIPYVNQSSGNLLAPVDRDALDGEPSDDYDLNSFRGIVKDFGLKLTGPRAGGAQTNGWNGFSVAVGDVSNIMQRSWTRFPAGTHLHVLLAPISPLLDGSQGWPVDIDFALAYLAENQDRDGCAWSGVPFARYTVSALYALPDGRKQPARVDIEPGGTQLADPAVLDFKFENDKFTGPAVLTPYVFVNDER
jgi:hypothetical protein